jgi:hypothetical protein
MAGAAVFVSESSSIDVVRVDRGSVTGVEIVAVVGGITTGVVIGTPIMGTVVTGGGIVGGAVTTGVVTATNGLYGFASDAHDGNPDPGRYHPGFLLTSPR